VNSLLNFSRTSATELTEVQINRVIQETLSLLEHQMKKASMSPRSSAEGMMWVSMFLIVTGGLERTCWSSSQFSPLA